MKGLWGLAIFSLSYAFYGHITQDTTWRDTVLITGDVVVDSGVCLTIDPGAVVMFLADSSEWDWPKDWPQDPPLGNMADLTINGGEIKANGDFSAPIVLTSTADTLERSPPRFPEWGGVLIRGSSSTVSNLNVKYAVFGLYVFNARSFIVRNCHIEYCCTRGISVEVTDSVCIEDNRINHLLSPWAERPGVDGLGIYCGGDKVLINRNIIKDIRGHKGDKINMLEGGGNAHGIYIKAKECVVEGNDISGCVGGYGEELPSGSAFGILVISTKAILRNNHVRHIRGVGDNGHRESPGNGIGIFVSKSTVTVDIDSNIISDCIGGSSYPANGAGIGLYLNNAYGKVTRNCISHCQENIRNRFTGIGIVCSGNSSPTIGGLPANQNDICFNSHYNLMNLTTNDIIATYNYWGTTDPDTIAKYIFDKEDSSDLGRVIYEPWAEYPGIDEKVKRKDERINLSAYPNPCRRKIEIRWEIGKKSPESFKVYDISGRVIRTFTKIQSPEPGAYKVVWDGRDDKGQLLPSGVYFVRLKAGSYSKTQKVILFR